MATYDRRMFPSRSRALLLLTSRMEVGGPGGTRKILVARTGSLILGVSGSNLYGFATGIYDLSELVHFVSLSRIALSMTTSDRPISPTATASARETRPGNAKTANAPFTNIDTAIFSLTTRSVS